MTQFDILVIMKPWTPEDLHQRLAQLMGPGGAESDARARTRLRILEVATDHFVRFGFRRASVGEIARDAGLGKGTLYLYFDSKQTLLVAAVSREKLALVPKMKEVYALPKEEQLEAFLRVSLLFTLESPLSSALIRGDRELDSVFAELQATQTISPKDVEQGLVMMVDLISGAAPGLSEAQQRALASMLSAIARLPAHLSATDGLSTGMSNEAFASLYAKILARGVAALEAES